jgi:hypothetical protein
VTLPTEGGEAGGFAGAVTPLFPEMVSVLVDATSGRGAESAGSGGSGVGAVFVAAPPLAGVRLESVCSAEELSLSDSKVSM